MERREFLMLSMMASVVACAPRIPMALAQAEPAKRGITAATIAEAEKLFGVTYTPTEREQIASEFEGYIAQVEARRAHALSLDDPPAMTFDPLLPGRQRPRGVNRVKLPASKRALPRKDVDIAHAPLADLSHWIRKKKITSKRLTELYLARLEAHGPTLNCVVTLTKDLALSQAADADREIKRGQIRSPLHGIPWGAKDLFDTKGVKTTFGATPFKERVPDRDAFIVGRLREAGAVLVAKLTLGALAYGDQWFDGRTRNPWNPAEGSSGSSAGSASAVVAGLVGFAIGTETLGSIVSPSMRCGSTGFRPSFGRVARTGAMPLCWSLDKTGPLCRSVSGTMAVLEAIQGEDVADPSSRALPLRFDSEASVQGMKLGYVKAHFEGADSDPLDAKALEAAKALGVQLIEVEFPELPYPALLTSLFAEAAAAFEDLTLSNTDDQMVWQEAIAWPNTFRSARLLSAVDLVQCDRFRRRVMNVIDGIYEHVDAIVSPSYAGNLLTITNYTGNPSLTLRTGFQNWPTRTGFGHQPPDDAEGPNFEVPHSVTLWGKLYEDGALAQLGAALEKRLGVWKRRPPQFG